jgi:hypothetical protein
VAYNTLGLDGLLPLRGELIRRGQELNKTLGLKRPLPLRKSLIKKGKDLARSLKKDTLKSGQPPQADQATKDSGLKQ